MLLRILTVIVLALAAPAAIAQDADRSSGASGEGRGAFDAALTGVWTGLAKGGPPIPPEGVPLTLVLDARKSGAPKGWLTVAGNRSPFSEVQFDSEARRLSARAQLFGIVVSLEATFEGEAMEGVLSGSLYSAQIEAERKSREVPAAEPEPAREVDLDSLTTEQWREDLQFLAAELGERHANLHHTLSAEEWRAAVAALDERLDELDADQTVLELSRLVARIGDAHTGLSWSGLRGFEVTPIELVSFQDGVFVTAVLAEYTELAGCQVIRVGDAETEEALAAAATTFCAENDSWLRVKAPRRLMSPRFLHALGMNPTPESVRFTGVTAEGEERSAELRPNRSRSQVWVRLPDSYGRPVPRWRERDRENYWFELIEHPPALYVAYNRCAEDPGRPMTEFAAEALAAAEEAGAERVIVDLRNNSGGSSIVLDPLLKGLKEHARWSEPARVFALIGPRTYSSGMMNAYQLRDDCGAVLVGEPTGGKPNGYGEVQMLRLPNSGIRVACSTKYFEEVPGNPDALEPHVLVELRSEDFFAGLDPVLERALTIPAGEPFAEAEAGETGGELGGEPR